MSRVILLAEDDPITREVIGTHLRQLGFLVDSTTSIVEAARLGARRTYSALVFDRNLQGGDASGLLTDFRASSMHPNAQTPAIAMSAELLDVDLDQLMAVGFADVIEKPVSPMRLRLALTQCGVQCGDRCAEPVAGPEPGASPRSIPVLDDALGVDACGSSEVLSGLRGLLAAELPGYLVAIAEAMVHRDPTAVADVVHRMKSALAFCGASEMLHLLQHLQIAPLEADRFAAVRAGAQRLSDRLDSNR